MSMTQDRRSTTILIALLCVGSLLGCGEWSGVMLRNPETKQHAVCLKDRGYNLPPEQIMRLRQCIQACQARGFELVDPSEMPPAIEGSSPTWRPLVPSACHAASVPASGAATGNATP